MGGVILIWDASPGLTAKSGWKLQQGLQWYLYQKGLNKEVFDNYVLKGVVFSFGKIHLPSTLFPLPNHIVICDV